MKLNREEFERMALEHIDLLYRLARRLTHSTEKAEDLVQETYLRAIRSWDTFELKSYGVRPWLIRILHNLYISQSQRDQRAPQGVDPEYLDISPYNSPPPSGAAAGAMIFDGMDQQLVKALLQMPGEYQLVMLLYAVEDLSYKEISEALDIPLGTVMSRLHRARQRLSEQLHDFAVKERIIKE